MRVLWDVLTTQALTLNIVNVGLGFLLAAVNASLSSRNQHWGGGVLLNGSGNKRENRRRAGKNCRL